MHRNVLSLVGNTPTIELTSEHEHSDSRLRLFAKLEGYNPTGSIKDRPAAYIIRKLLLTESIDREYTIIESSSGNFGVALAAVCRAEGLRFVCIVDPNALESNIALMRQYGAEIDYVDQRDDSGGYLKNRNRRAQELEQQIEKSIWLRQHCNRDNAWSHYYGTGMEIYKTFADVGLHYAFIAVGSGGTISGVSRVLKELVPSIRIVAVDVNGSAVFGHATKRRFIPGMGSSIRPPLVEDAVIDEVVHVDEEQIVGACKELVERYGVFCGGSSGAVYHAAKCYADVAEGPISYPRQLAFAGARRHAVLIFPDRGGRYIQTIYSEEWVDARYHTELAGRSSD